MPFTVVSLACELPMFMKLLPNERYGQFCSANAMIRALAIAVFSYLAGQFMSVMKYFTPGKGDYYYRYLFIWGGVFGIINFICLIGLYRHWKRLGGKENYRPPAV